MLVWCSEISSLCRVLPPKFQHGGALVGWSLDLALFPPLTRANFPARAPPPPPLPTFPSAFPPQTYRKCCSSRTSASSPSCPSTRTLHPCRPTATSTTTAKRPPPGTRKSAALRRPRLPSVPPPLQRRRRIRLAVGEQLEGAPPCTGLQVTGSAVGLEGMGVVVSASRGRGEAGVEGGRRWRVSSP